MSDSPDDAFEDTRQDQLNYRVGDTKLPEDNDRPAALADDQDNRLPEDHPNVGQEADVDETESYNSGRTGDNE